MTDFWQAPIPTIIGSARQSDFNAKDPAPQGAGFFFKIAYSGKKAKKYIKKAKKMLDKYILYGIIAVLGEFPVYRYNIAMQDPLSKVREIFLKGA